MIQRSLSFSQISVIDYGVNNSNELGKVLTSLVILSSEKLSIICLYPYRTFFLPRWDIYDLCFLTGLPIQQYFGPLEINTDVGFLAGHSLLVTEKDNLQKKSGHYILKKAASVSYRSTTSRLFTSASTEESPETGDLTKTTKQPKQRWSLQLFGVKVI